MKKTILFLLFASTFLWGIQLTLDQNVTATSQLETNESKHYFGEQLFQGNFKENTQFRYNPDYLLNIGDVVSVKLWGAYEFAEDLTIDKQGNIFIPQIGVINLLGLPADEIQAALEYHVQKVFNKDVFVYADIKQYQPISVFVSGPVKKVGLYNGLSTDSVLQFIDKAGGIIRGEGSYRHITILRDKKIIKQIDLYSFLLNGNVDTFQFENGDVILVGALQNFIEIEGDVSRPYIFELSSTSTSVASIIPYVLPKPTVNRFMLTRQEGMNEVTKEYNLSMAKQISIGKGEKLDFFTNLYVSNANISIEGEHTGLQHLSVSNGTSLYDVLKEAHYTPLSDIRNIRLYRKSVAQMQQQLIDTHLKELEAQALTTDSASAEEATIRSKEAELVLQFIQRAKQVKVLGQIVLNPTDNLKKLTLEDDDRIFIPQKSNIVVVQGEVGIPNSLTYQENYSVKDYIDACGGFGLRADKEKILLVKANGKVIEYNYGSFGNSSPKVDPGDSILVLSKIDSKNIIITKDITQILYQVAVGAAVVLKGF